MKSVYVVLFSEGIDWDAGHLVAIASNKDEAFAIARHYATTLTYAKVERELLEAPGFSLVIMTNFGDAVIVQEYKIQTLASFIKDGRQ